VGRTGYKDSQEKSNESQSDKGQSFSTPDTDSRVPQLSGAAKFSLSEPLGIIGV
jgi:hypothetical protein